MNKIESPNPLLIQIADLRDNRIATVKDNVSLLPYPKPLYEDYSQSPKYPIAIALTEFHILLAYTDSIKGMCLLSKEVVYEDQYNEAFGKLVSVIRDSRTGNTFLLNFSRQFFNFLFNL